MGNLLHCSPVEVYWTGASHPGGGVEKQVVDARHGKLLYGITKFFFFISSPTVGLQQNSVLSFLKRRIFSGVTFSTGCHPHSVGLLNCLMTMRNSVNCMLVFTLRFKPNHNRTLYIGLFFNLSPTLSVYVASNVTLNKAVKFTVDACS